MSDSLFSLSSLAIVTPVVTLATYAIVLNLDRISQVFVPLTPTTTTPSRSPMQSFITSQVRKMQRDESIAWRERGEDFEKSRVDGKSGGRPLTWRALQYFIRGMFLPVWNALVIVFAFFLHTLMCCRTGQRQRRDNGSIPTSVRNLGDVEIQIQVDVNVEKG
jgi:hypothetical protein